MKIKWLHLILSVLIFSINVSAQDYPEPFVHQFEKPKDYSQHKYGYDTQGPCTGAWCIPAHIKVGCGSYEYLAGLAPGTKLQVCHINKLDNDGKVEAVPESKNYTMVTGFIDEANVFHVNVPANELFLSTLDGHILKKNAQTVEGEVPVCTLNCPDGLQGKILNVIKPIKDAITAQPVMPAALKRQVGELMAAKTAPKGGFSKGCLEFIKTNGSFGPLGISALKAIKKVGWQYFDGGSSSVNFDSVCPNYRKFDKATKEYYLVYSFASMAEEESTCNPEGSNPHGANDIADGLFQMEFSAGQRKNAGRDKRYCPYTEVDSREINFQMECTASIFKDINCRLPNNDVTGKGGYWDELRGTDIWHYRNKKTKKSVKVTPEISWHMMDFPGCGATKPKSAPAKPVIKSVAKR